MIYLINIGERIGILKSHIIPYIFFDFIIMNVIYKKVGVM